MVISSILIEDDKLNMRSIYSLEHVFDNLGSFEVPPFQREYVWENSNIEQLKRDIDEIVFVDNQWDDKNVHFMGVIIAADTDNKRILLDGQQRIITAICAFSAAVEILPDSKISSINSFVSRVISCSGKEIKILVSLNNVELDIAKKCISVLELKDVDFRNSEFNARVNDASQLKNIKKAFSYFYHLFNKIGDDETVLFIKKLFTQTRFIYLRTDDINEAFSLFESLNSRGKSLRATEMVKNRCFRETTSGKRKYVEESWNTIMKNLDQCGISNHETFLQSFWNCTGTEDKIKRDIYGEYKTLLIDEKSTFDLIKKMVSASEMFKSLFIKKYDFDSAEFIEYLGEDKSKFIRHVRILKSFGYPRVLSSTYMAMLLSKMAYKDIENILIAFESIFIRNIWIVGEKLGKHIEHMDKVAREITIQGNYSNVYNKICSDREFKMKFDVKELRVGANSSDSIKLKMLFYALFDEYDLTKIDQNSTYNHVEHICPQSPKDAKPSLVEGYINNFGNLTILEGPINSAIKNNCYGEKYNGIPKKNVTSYKSSAYYFVKGIELIYQDKEDREFDNTKKLRKSVSDPPTVKIDAIWDDDHYYVWRDYIYRQITKNWPEIKGNIKIS